MTVNPATMLADAAPITCGHPDPYLQQALGDLQANGWIRGPLDYEVSILGKGGCGTVYRVTHRTNAALRSIAIKTPFAATGIGDLANERRMMSHVSRAPHCYNAHDDAAPYIAMEHVEGTTLEDLDASGVSANLRLELCTAVIQAVRDIMDAGVVHADIKPPNIMLRPDGSLKVLDFGLAVEAPQPHRRKAVGATKGTPLYMAPEQWDGEVDRHTDIFAAGCLLYHELSGHDIALQVTGGKESPWDIANAMHRKDTAGTIHDIIAAAHVPMRRLLERMLKLDPDRRPDWDDIIGCVQTMYRKMLRKSPGLAMMLSSQQTRSTISPTVLVPPPAPELLPTRRDPDRP